MYKVLVILSLLIFHPAWSYINEKGPGQGDVAVEADWPVHVSQAPTVIIKLARKGPEQSELFIQFVKGPGQGTLGVEEEGPNFMIQAADGRPSGPMGVAPLTVKLVGPEQGTLGVEEEGPNFMIQVADGRPSGPMGVAPLTVKLVGPEQSELFIQFVKGPGGQMPWVSESAEGQEQQ